MVPKINFYYSSFLLSFYHVGIEFLVGVVRIFYPANNFRFLVECVILYKINTASSSNRNETNFL